MLKKCIFNYILKVFVCVCAHVCVCHGGGRWKVGGSWFSLDLFSDLAASTCTHCANLVAPESQALKP